MKRDLVRLAAERVGPAGRCPAGGGPCCEDHGEVEAVQCCGNCPSWRHLDGSQDVGYTADDLATQAEDRLDIHAALNTYEVVDRAPGVYVDAVGHSVVGANSRRLIVRADRDGAWIGGCLISSAADLRRVISVLSGVAFGLESVATRDGVPTCFCGTGREHLKGQGYYCRPAGGGDADR